MQMADLAPQLLNFLAFALVDIVATVIFAVVFVILYSFFSPNKN